MVEYKEFILVRGVGTYRGHGGIFWQTNYHHANLRGMGKDIVLKAIFDPIGSNKQEICTYYHRAAIAVDVVVLVVVLVTEQCSNPRVSIDLKKIFN